MDVISTTSDVDILESIAFKESSKQATGGEIKLVTTAQSLQSETQSETLLDERLQAEQYEAVTSIQSSDLLPVCFLILWAIAVLVFLRFAPHRSKQTVCPVRRQIPCTTCRFFTNNPYLKCAVRPSTALTKQAIDCSDYQS